MRFFGFTFFCAHPDDGSAYPCADNEKRGSKNCGVKGELAVVEKKDGCPERGDEQNTQADIAKYGKREGKLLPKRQ